MEFSNIKNIIDVTTGKVKVSRGILSVGALGSCVAVLAYDEKTKIGALAHVMLPAKAPDKEKRNKTKYAVDAIDEMINRMSKLGTDKSNIRIYLIGGANVLKQENEDICKANIDSVIGFLEKKKLRILVKAVGGTQRRSILFDVENGVIRYTEGDKAQEILCKEARDANSRNND